VKLTVAAPTRKRAAGRDDALAGEVTMGAAHTSTTLATAARATLLLLTTTIIRHRRRLRRLA
jgi:hypothetical protein